jgi:hypothetical protein
MLPTGSGGRGRGRGAAECGGEAWERRRPRRHGAVVAAGCAGAELGLGGPGGGLAGCAGAELGLGGPGGGGVGCAGAGGTPAVRAAKGALAMARGPSWGSAVPEAKGALAMARGPSWGSAVPEVALGARGPAGRRRSRGWRWVRGGRAGARRSRGGGRRAVGDLLRGGHARVSAAERFGFRGRTNLRP